MFLGCICGYAMKTPGAPYLWEVNENTERLDKEEAKIFLSVAAKLFYIMKRKRPDIEPEVGYFTTLVSNINMDDCKKIKRCITFLKKSKGGRLIIGCFNLKELFTSIDASFAVHTNI